MSVNSILLLQHCNYLNVKCVQKWVNFYFDWNLNTSSTLGRKFLVFHCLAHKLELVFGGAMKQYESFKGLEKEANSLYAFYSKSHKRTNFLRDLVTAEDHSPVSLSKIFDVRYMIKHFEKEYFLHQIMF